MSMTIIGHRGAAGHAPENTIEGLRAAYELGCRWVEIDCVLTKDREIVLLHDERLGRTVNGSGSVSHWTLADLQARDAGAWFAERFRGAQVPTLSQAIAFLADHDMGAHFEIKPACGYERETGARVAKAVSALWPPRGARRAPPPILSSFSRMALAAARDAAPHLSRAILWRDIPGNWQESLSDPGAEAIHVRLDALTEQQAALFQTVQIPFRVYTVNDPGDAALVYSWGADAIFTDYPDRFL